MNNDARNSGFAGKSGRKTRKDRSRPDKGKSDSSKTPKLRSRGMKGPAADAPKRAYGAKSHGATTQPRSPKGRRARPQSKHEGGSGWIWGTHACLAALSNPRRTIHELLVTESAQNRLTLPSGGAIAQIVEPQTIDRILPKGTVHQGIALKAAPLEWPALEVLADNAADNGVILVLDQITDPHNVGAILRSAEVFGARAVVAPHRHSAPETGALAKTASGALERQPYLRVRNLSDTIVDLQQMGYLVLGLDGLADQTIEQATEGKTDRAIALVLGAEGPGLRQKTKETCDALVKIDAARGFGSLNVSNAAAVALYASLPR